MSSPTSARLPDEPAEATITGDAERGEDLWVTCGACHGHEAQGIKALNAPRMAGMTDWYLARQLENFKADIRGRHEDDLYGWQMAEMARILKDDDAINDVVAYINTLGETQVAAASDGGWVADLHRSGGIAWLKSPTMQSPMRICGRSRSPRAALPPQDLHRQVHLEPGCQDHRHPVRHHRHRHRLGGAGAVHPHAPAVGLPGVVLALIDPANYLQFVTMHGMIMVIYLLTALFLGGFGNYLIPLMCGARDMVFPYVNMISYWVYLAAVLILVASFFVPGGPTGAGWTLYPPQAAIGGTPGTGAGIILMLISLCVFIVGFTMGGLNYVVTVLQARTRGMTLMRMPLTVWGIFMATVLALLAFPALFRQLHHDDSGQAS